jgi:hypothetical protein
MAKLKLTVNEGKTQICKVPEGEFDFLCRDFFYRAVGLELSFFEAAYTT